MILNEKSVLVFLQGLLSPIIREAIREELAQKSTTEQKPSSDRPLSIDQASEYCGLAKQTLYQMASRGKIPCSRRGKRLIFLESELLSWIKEGKKS